MYLSNNIFSYLFIFLWSSWRFLFAIQVRDKYSNGFLSFCTLSLSGFKVGGKISGQYQDSNIVCRVYSNSPIRYWIGIMKQMLTARGLVIFDGRTQTAVGYALSLSTTYTTCTH